MKFITLLAVPMIFVATPSTSEIHYIQPQNPKPIVQQIVSEKEKVITAVLIACDKYGADKALALTIVSLENPDYDPKLQSRIPNKTGPNGREDSWGIAQIHLPDHPTITREQAKDLTFSAEFLAKNLAQGKCSLWSTCPLAMI